MRGSKIGENVLLFLKYLLKCTNDCHFLGDTSERKRDFIDGYRNG